MEWLCRVICNWEERYHEEKNGFYMPTCFCLSVWFEWLIAREKEEKLIFDEVDYIQINLMEKILKDRDLNFYSIVCIHLGMNFYSQKRCKYSQNNNK